MSGRIGHLPRRVARDRVSAGTDGAISVANPKWSGATRKLLSAAVAVMVCVVAAEPARADPNPFAVLGCSCHETASAGSPDLQNEIEQGIRQGLATPHRP